MWRILPLGLSVTTGTEHGQAVREGQRFPFAGMSRVQGLAPADRPGRSVPELDLLRIIPKRREATSAQRTSALAVPIDALEAGT
jgi:hypothetical protein